MCWLQASSLIENSQHYGYTMTHSALLNIFIYLAYLVSFNALIIIILGLFCHGVAFKQT